MPDRRRSRQSKWRATLGRDSNSTVADLFNESTWHQRACDGTGYVDMTAGVLACSYVPLDRTRAKLPPLPVLSADSSRLARSA